MDSYRSTNYFVDVLFGVSTGQDVNPPAVTAVTPVNGATGVAVNSSVNVQFSESLNFSTVNSSTFELRNAAGTLIPCNRYIQRTNNDGEFDTIFFTFLLC